MSSRYQAVLTPAANVVPQPISWLWDKWIARGKISILAGAGGCGKTTLALSLAAINSIGAAWPDGASSRGPGKTFIWSAEDDIEDTLTPRLIAAGADLNSVFFVSGRQNEHGELQPFNPARDFSLLHERAEQTGGVSLLLIDPIVSLVSGDMHRANDVRNALQQLVDFAARWNCSVLGITHLAKGAQLNSPADRIIGSQAFSALARTVLIATQQECSTSRILVRAKSNIGPDHGGLRYEVEEIDLPAGLTSTRVAWGETVNGSARELLADFELPDEGPRSQLQLATEFLREALADGPMPTTELEQAAEAAGLAWATVRRAQRRVAVARKNGAGGSWVWALRNEGDQGAQAAQAAQGAS